MDAEKAKEKIRETKNIYDVLIVLYGCIDNENQPAYLQQYYGMINKKKTEWMLILDSTIDAVLKGSIDFFRCKLQLADLITEQNMTLLCTYILFRFEQVFAERYTYPRLGFNKQGKMLTKYPLGPLDSGDSDYRLYLKAADQGLAVLYMEGNKKKFRQICRRDGSDIFSIISSYRIIKKSRLDFGVIVEEYGEDLFANLMSEGSVLRVAAAPLGCTEWFGINYMDNKAPVNDFEITEKKENRTAWNNKILDILEEMEKREVNIAVFPELALNEKTEAEVKKYLMRKTLGARQNHLKLVFLGSLWSGGENKCVLLSGSGTVLVRNAKKNPFEIKKDGKLYREKLSKRPKEYSLVDIRNLGRILYEICKDGLEDREQAIFWNEFGVNMEIISAYTASLGYFEEQLNDLAVKYLGVGLVGNACAARGGGNDMETLGFLEFPAIDTQNANRTVGIKEWYVRNESCRANCQGKCFHIFEINSSAFCQNGQMHFPVRYFMVD